MRPDLRTIYNAFLLSASEAVKRRDKQAALFCLSHAMKCANTVHDNPEYKRKVMRALNFARSL
jgi:hypothetical protein